MLSTYITSLFNNCKALEKKPEYSPAEVEEYFTSEIRTAILGADLRSEADLILQLVQKPFRELVGLFSAHPCLEIFYLVNSLSEYGKSECYDELGRFTYDGSVQRILGIE